MVLEELVDSQPAGLTQSAAAGAIAEMLDDDGKTKDHKDLGESRDQGAPNPAGETQDELDQVDDGTAGEAEGDDQVDEDGNQDAKAGAGDADSEGFETLDELAEALEVAPEELLKTLKHTVKAAGQEATVTLADLVTGYQLKADYDRDKTALADQRREFETAQTTRVQEFEQNANVLANQFNLVEQHIAARLNDPALLQLRTEDPAQFLLQQQQIEGEVGSLRQARAQAAQQYQQFMEGERTTYMKQQGERLAKEVDGWGKEKLQASIETIKSLGFDEGELAGIADARFIKGALELASLRAENAALKKKMATGETAVKEAKKAVPRGLKPGKASLGRKLDKTKIGKLRNVHNKAKSVKSAASLIEQFL